MMAVGVLLGLAGSLLLGIQIGRRLETDRQLEAWREALRRHAEQAFVPRAWTEEFEERIDG